jgi:hypothetical protein
MTAADQSRHLLRARILVLIRLCFGGLSLLGAPGCSGGKGSASAPATIEEFEEQAFDAYCDYNVTCGLMPDRATCRQSYYPLPSQRETDIEGVAAKTLVYDPSRAEACLALYRTQPCTISDSVARVSEALEKCARVLVGTVAAGAGCFFAEQCLPGLVCNAASCASSCCPGTCTERIADGVACSPTGAPCGALSSCIAGATADTYFCRSAPLEGDACWPDGNCGGTLICIDSTGSAATSGHCRKRAAHGAACAFPASDDCDRAGDYCDRTTKTCVSRGDVGQPCTDDTNCRQYASCSTTTHVCTPKLKLGEVCNPGRSQACLGGLMCDSASGLCVAHVDGPACH